MCPVFLQIGFFLTFLPACQTVMEKYQKCVEKKYSCLKWQRRERKTERMKEQKKEKQTTLQCFEGKGSKQRSYKKMWWRTEKNNRETKTNQSLT